MKLRNESLWFRYYSNGLAFPMFFLLLVIIIELLDMNKDQAITCINACGVHDTGLTCHSYNMTDVNMTNKTLVKNLYFYDDAFELK